MYFTNTKNLLKGVPSFISSCFFIFSDRSVKRNIIANSLSVELFTKHAKGGPTTAKTEVYIYKPSLLFPKNSAKYDTATLFSKCFFTSFA